MKHLIFPIAAVAVLVFVGAARAAADPSTPVLASPGSSPFGGCTSDWNRPRCTTPDAKRSSRPPAQVFSKRRLPASTTKT
jgi:hypothetical protein